MQEINLYDLLKHYARNWLFIFACTLVGFAVGFFYNNYLQVPMYKSNATLLVLNNTALETDTKPTTINNYLELLKSRRVLEPVMRQLHLDKTYEEIVSSVTTTNDKDTEVVKLTIATTDPQKSKEIVDATVVSFKKEINRLYNTDTIQVIDSANLPSAAYNVRKNIQLVLFAVAGFLFSVIATFFIYDYRLSTGNIASVTTAKVRRPKFARTKLTAKKLTVGFARIKAQRSVKKQARTKVRSAKKHAKSLANEEARVTKNAIFAQKQAEKAKQAKKAMKAQALQKKQAEAIIVKPVRGPKASETVSKLQKPKKSATKKRASKKKAKK